MTPQTCHQHNLPPLLGGLGACFKLVQQVRTISQQQCMHSGTIYTHVTDTSFRQPGGAPYALDEQQPVAWGRPLRNNEHSGPSELTPANAADTQGMPARAADSQPPSMPANAPQPELDHALRNCGRSGPLEQAPANAADAQSTPQTTAELFAAAAQLSSPALPRRSAPKQRTRRQPEKQRNKKKIGGLNSYNLFKSYAKHCNARGDQCLSLLDYAKNCANGKKETAKNSMCKKGSHYASNLTGNKCTHLKQVNEILRTAWRDTSSQRKQEYKDACALALAERS